MNERCCYKHSGTEVLAEEESAGRDLHPFDLLCHDRKSGSTDTGDEDDDWQGQYSFEGEGSCVYVQTAAM